MPNATRFQPIATTRSARRRQLTTDLCLLVWLVGTSAGSAVAETGTFLDRQRGGDLRLVSYNILFDTIFPDENPQQAEKFARVVQALDPDIMNLQEVQQPAASVVALFNTIAPLPGGASWYAAYGDNVIVSKYPITALPSRGARGGLVDLPDDRYSKDLFVMNNHFTCCGNDPLGWQETSRQHSADELVTVMKDARTSGGQINLPQDTPMLVVGDLNIVMDPGVYDPLGTLLTGDVHFEDLYGSDSPPDWDGTSLADAHPLHNARGPDDYTWRDDGQNFDPGRLDYILYTDSVLGEANKFVLNTVEMTPTERAATGLEELDITVDQAGSNYDHLPLVVDFRLVPEPATVVNAATMLALLVVSWPRRTRPAAV